MEKDHTPASSTWVLRDYSTHGNHNPAPHGTTSNTGSQLK